MLGQPPKSTRTDTPFPSTTLFRSNRRRWLAATPGWLTRRMGIAASLLLALTLGLAWLAMRPDAYATHIGERQLAVLDDGSRVSLDAVTKVKVRMKDEARQVELLEGQIGRAHV